MSRLVLLPYRMGSGSARSLARALGIRRVYPDRNFRPRRSSAVVNWGSSRLPNWSLESCRVLNHPRTVALASDKLACLEAFQSSGVPTVPWTPDRTVAEGWLAKGETVFARLSLNGHSGEGIEIVRPGGELPIAPLFTIYRKKRREYRLHVFGSVLLDVQEKRLRLGSEPSLIRSHGRGYVFCREDIELPEDASSVAVQAVNALGLDFGAVDIIQAREGSLALEVNTAPGLEGSTLERYREAIHSWHSA